MSWSSGKDSTLALHTVRSSGIINVTGLLTTVNSTAERVAMHVVRRSLLEAQADALGLPLYVVELPWPCPNDVYEARMSAAMAVARTSGSTPWCSATCSLRMCADIARTRRAARGSRPCFLYGSAQPRSLRGELVSLGVRAVITCVDPNQAPRELAGRWYDEALPADLPPTVDPCGENGEFHTFVVDGPGFTRSLDVIVGETVERDGFVFTDVTSASGSGIARRGRGDPGTWDSGRDSSRR